MDNPNVNIDNDVSIYDNESSDFVSAASEGNSVSYLESEDVTILTKTDDSMAATSALLMEKDTDSESDDKTLSDAEEDFVVNTTNYDPTVPQGKIDVEIVGLNNPTNGRSCSIHECCGQSIKRGALVRLVRGVIEIKGNTEYCIKVIKVVDSSDSCFVGYIPRVQSTLPHVLNNIDKFAVVKELYHDSTSKYKRDKSLCNFGMGGLCFLSLFHKNV